MPPPIPKITSLQRQTHRNFHQAALLDLAGQCKYLCALTLFCAHGTESSPTVIYDPRNIRKCFYVVDIRRLLPVIPLQPGTEA